MSTSTPNIRIRGLHVRKSFITGQNEPGAADEAGICFRQGLDATRRQPAKSLELRATISLARLWRDQGKIAEAREVAPWTMTV